jgi:hypothetical protein
MSLDNTQFSEEFIDNFSAYYSETEDIYGDNMEEAFNDFVEMSQDEYGFVSTMGNMASKAGSAIKTGATAVGGAAKKTLGSTMKSAATGAAIGAGVNAMRGKSMVKGAVGGAAIGGAASQVYKRFSQKDNKEQMNNERFYSEEELHADQFAAYYAETEDIYGDDLETAYNDFVEMSQDEYGFVSTMGNMASKAGSAIKTGATAVGGAAKKTLGSTMKSAATGAAIGAGVNAMRGKSMVKGAVGGAAIGGAASQVYKRFSQKDNKEQMNNERFYSEEELHADQFAAYYAETEDIYGDDLETAYNDFLEFSQESMDEVYSEEDNDELVDLFSEFYAENSDVYGDTEEGMEEAYADFMSALNEEEEEEEGEDNTYSEEIDFEDFYAETYDIYGDNLEEAYADFIQFTETEEEESEDEYGLKDMARKVAKGFKNTLGEGGSVERWIDKTGAKMKKAGISSPYGANHKVFSAEDESEDLDVFSDGFATYYAENEDLYGDSDEGLEEAYDDYADIAAEDALEAQYSAFDSEYSILGSMKAKKNAFLKRNNTAKGKALVGGLKGAGIGAGLGLAGGLIAGSVGAEAKERRALKSKAKAGTLTESEKVRYNELKANRRKKIALATGAGVVGGAAVGAGVGYAKEKAGIAKDIKNNVGSVVTSQQISKSGMSKADQQSLVDSLKKKRADRADRNGKAGKEGDGTSYFSDKAEKSFSAVDLLGTPGTFGSKVELKSVTKSEDKTFSDEGDRAPKSFVLDILKK